MTRKLAVLVFLACASAAQAEEQPCRADGATVVCQREGFDILVGKLLDAKSAAAKCVLESELRTADAAILKTRLGLANAERDKALADVTVLRSKPVPYGRRLAAVGLGTVSGLAGSLGASASSEVATASLFSVAIVSAATAVVLVLSE